jgi:hypothetical protein
VKGREISLPQKELYYTAMGSSMTETRIFPGAGRVVHASHDLALNRRRRSLSLRQGQKVPSDRHYFDQSAAPSLKTSEIAVRNYNLVAASAYRTEGNIRRITFDIVWRWLDGKCYTLYK